MEDARREQDRKSGLDVGMKLDLLQKELREMKKQLSSKK